MPCSGRTAPVPHFCIVDVVSVLFYGAVQAIICLAGGMVNVLVHQWHRGERHRHSLRRSMLRRSRGSRLHRLKPVNGLDLESGASPRYTNAAKQVVLQVESDIAVFLDGAEDLDRGKFRW